jgi:hypothetical protein
MIAASLRSHRRTNPTTGRDLCRARRGGGDQSRFVVVGMSRLPEGVASSLENAL